MAFLKPKSSVKWSSPLPSSQLQALIQSQHNPQKAFLLFNASTSKDLPSFLLLISRLVSSNLLPLAESLLPRILPETHQPVPETAFVPLIRAHGKAHNPLHSLRLFRLMTSPPYDITPTHKSFNALLAVLVSSNQLKLARTVYNEMKEAGVAPTVTSYNVLIKALCSKASTLDAAVRVFRGMETPDSCSYGTLIDGLCKHGRVDDARKVFDEMSVRKIERTVVTYTSFIHGLCRVGRLDDALEVFDEMRKRGVRANVVTYSCLVDGLCKGGRATKAKGLLERMVKDGCPPNMISYSSLINGLCMEGKVLEAAEVLDRMRLQGKKPDAGLYGKIVTGLCELGKANEAANYLDEMVLSGVAPNRVTRSLHVRIHNRVVGSLCNNGESNRGFRVYQSMKTRGISVDPESFHVLISCYCKKKDVHRAAQIVEEMLIDGFPPNYDTWCLFMSQYLRRRKVKEAAELMWDELVGERRGSQILIMESEQG